MGTRQRNSAVEMLRILSMLMVLVVHFVGGAFGLPWARLQFLNATEWLKLALEALAIVGVNCFVLISGYYGIRTSLKGLLRYVGICLFASLVVWLARCIDGHHVADGFVDSLLVFSHTDLWFVPAYLALYLLSPLLNGGFEALTSRRRVLVGFVSLTAANVWLGWVWGGSVNPTGYNVMQMIYLYYIGRMLNSFADDLRRITPAVWFAIYLAACVGTALMMNFDYNSPTVLAASVALFMAFATMKPFCNRFVNAVAASSFMVYLLHKAPYVWVNLKWTLIGWSVKSTAVVFAMKWLGLLVGVFIAAILIDWARVAMVRVCRLRRIEELADKISARLGL